MYLRSAVIVAVCAVSRTAVAQQSDCSHDSGVGVSFDLSPLASQSGYKMIDANNRSDPNGPQSGVTAQWQFAFSVCNDMDPNAGFPGAPDASICATTTSDDGTVSTSAPAPAYKYCIKNCETLRPDTKMCNRLGDTASNAVLSTHPWNLASGVTIAYSGGDLCRSRTDGSMVPRSLRVSLQCVDQGQMNGSVSYYDDILPFASGCAWTALVRTQFACPNECPQIGRPGILGKPLCAQNGICGYDGTHSVARCFCNKGWGGVGCSEPTSAPGPAPAPTTAPQSYTGSIAGALAGGVVGGAALLLAAVAVKAKLSNSTFVDAIDFSFGLGGGGGGAKVGSGGGYAAAPSFTGAAFTGAADTAYVAPDADVGAVGSSGDSGLLA